MMHFRQAQDQRVSWGEMIVTEARSWIGTPFVWQASVKGRGCDCKGLVSGVFAALGRAEADSLFAARADYAEGQVDAALLRMGLSALFTRVEAAAVGDVMLCRIGGKAQHLAIVAEATGGVPRRMIHTYSKGPACVVEVPVGTAWGAALDSLWRVK